MLSSFKKMISLLNEGTEKVTPYKNMEEFCQHTDDKGS
jgi:hypothetical protein